MKLAVVVALLIVAVTAGFLTWKQIALANDARAAAIGLCKGDAACREAVRLHFEPCLAEVRSHDGRFSVTAARVADCIDRKVAESTMRDIRLLARTWEAHTTDYNTYLPWPRLDNRYDSGLGDPVSFSRARRIDYPTMAAMLTPTYARELPERDGWGRDFEFGVSRDGGEYLIRSLAKDGVPDESAYSRGTTRHPDCDIVYFNGKFIAYPEGAKEE